MKEKFIQLAKKLGFISKIQAGTMENDDWKTLKDSFKEEHGVDLDDAIIQLQTPIASVNAEQQELITALFGELDEEGNPITAGDAGGDDGNGGDGTHADGNGSEGKGASGSQKPKKQMSVDDMAKQIIEMRRTITALKAEGEKGDGIRVKGKGLEGKKILIAGPGTTAKHLFGIENEMFARSKRWNKNAAALKASDEKYSKADQSTLMSEFDALGEKVGARFNELFMNAQLPALVAGDLDYSDLESELGEYYQVRRMDAIIDYILKLDSVANIFPVRYNVQDEEVIINVFEGKSFSQGYQSGRVFAGGFKFTPDKAKVKDVMFKYMFEDLKDLERQYIGYLNREGSDPIKWGFIEWILVMCAKIQHNEVEERRIAGVRVESASGKAAYYMYASDGILTTLDRYKEENKVYVFDDLKAYTTSTILEYVRTFVRYVWRMKGKVATTGFVLYMNELDLPDFKEAYREAYGADNDFTGSKVEVKDFPLPKIVGVPNMGDRQDMWMCPEGIIEIQENKPGEFMSYYFEREFEQLFVMSYKKEGTFAFAGREFSTNALLVASKGKHTNIFANNPVAELEADATTADAGSAEMFETVANTGETVFTDFTDAVQGVAYKLVCGSTANATTIAKSDKFANITAEWTPTVEGDYIRVIYDPTDNVFWEIDRKVGGTITTNDALTAPEYVEEI
jgi:hypothetical protein